MASSPALKRFRIVLWSLVAVAAAGAIALYVLRPPAGAGAVSGSDFAMESTKGGTFTQADLKGTPSLVFFGYTYCPDVCPTTLAESMGWREDTGVGYDRMRTILVTVDPERDTKDVLANYIGAFDENIIGLTGTQQQTEAIKASFGVYSEKGETDATGGYIMNHTATVFLLDGDGNLASTIAYGENTATAEAKIKRLIEG